MCALYRYLARHGSIAKCMRTLASRAWLIHETERWLYHFCLPIDMPYEATKDAKQRILKRQAAVRVYVVRS